MEKEKEEEKLQQAPPLPVIPRLDRLDRLLNRLEEKHSMSSGRHLCNPAVKKTKEEDNCISLSSALEEVHQKGTLMDRLAMLENRVLQLSIEMDEGKTSRSSSSTVHVSKNIFGHDLVMSKVSRHHHDDQVVKVPPPIQERSSDEECRTTTLTEEGSGRKREKRKGYSKWISWFRCDQQNDDFGPNTMKLRSKTVISP